jgi:Phage gp6-like head-tail connector protein
MTWAPDYVTLAELKSYLRISDTDDDAQLALYITAASRAVDDYAHRQFGKVATTEARVYPARWDRHRGRWVVEVDDLQTTTGLVVQIGGVAVTDYVLEPRNAVLKGLAWTTLVLGTAAEAVPTVTDEYAVTGTAAWGWTAVPSAIMLATRLQAARFSARRDSPYGIAGSPDQGSELRLLARVDPDVAVSLSKYERNWWAS